MVVPAATEHDVEVCGVELDAEDALGVRVFLVVERFHELDSLHHAIELARRRVVDAHVDVSAASGEDLSATVEVETLNVVAFDVCFDICVLRFWRSTLFNDVDTVSYVSYTSCSRTINNDLCSLVFSVANLDFSVSCADVGQVALFWVETRN